jgi:hypothetical protein
MTQFTTGGAQNIGNLSGTITPTAGGTLKDIWKHEQNYTCFYSSTSAAGNAWPLTCQADKMLDGDVVPVMKMDIGYTVDQRVTTLPIQAGTNVDHFTNQTMTLSSDDTSGAGVGDTGTITTTVPGVIQRFAQTGDPTYFNHAWFTDTLLFEDPFANMPAAYRSDQRMATWFVYTFLPGLITEGGSNVFSASTGQHYAWKWSPDKTVAGSEPVPGEPKFSVDLLESN